MRGNKKITGVCLGMGLLLLLTVSLLFSRFVLASKVVDLTIHNYRDYIGKGIPALVDFRCEGCGPPIEGYPAYEALAEVYSDDRNKITIAMEATPFVGGPVSKKLHLKLPSHTNLVWFSASGKEHEFLQGDRDLYSLIDFISEKKGISPSNAAESVCLEGINGEVAWKNLLSAQWMAPTLVSIITRTFRQCIRPRNLIGRRNETVSNVVKLDVSNFDQLIGKGRPALVIYKTTHGIRKGRCNSYHCAIAPVYEALADAFANASDELIIGEVTLDTFGGCIPPEFHVRGFPSLMWFDAAGRESIQHLDFDQTALAVNSEAGTPTLESTTKLKAWEYKGRRDIFLLIDILQAKTGIRAGPLPDLLRAEGLERWVPVPGRCHNLIAYDLDGYDVVDRAKCAEFYHDELGQRCLALKDE